MVGRGRYRDRGASASQFFQPHIPRRRIEDARTLCGPPKHPDRRADCIVDFLGTWGGGPVYAPFVTALTVLFRSMSQ